MKENNIAILLVRLATASVLAALAASLLSCSNTKQAQFERLAGEVAAPVKVGSVLPSVFTRTFPVEIDRAKVERRSYHSFCKGLAGVGLQNDGDITFDSPKKAVDELSLEEKALLSSFTLEGLVYSVGKTYLLTREVPAELSDIERYKRLLQPSFERELNRLTPSEIQVRMRPYISPVSRTILRFNCAEFEPGQAYITVVTSEPLREAWFNAVVDGFEDTGYPKEKIAVVYFRVYGEEGVIAEELTEVIVAKDDADHELLQRAGLGSCPSGQAGQTGAIP